jgi:hypothetical protein
MQKTRIQEDIKKPKEEEVQEPSTKTEEEDKEPPELIEDDEEQESEQEEKKSATEPVDQTTLEPRRSGREVKPNLRLQDVESRFTQDKKSKKKVFSNQISEEDHMEFIGSVNAIEGTVMLSPENETPETIEEALGDENSAKKWKPALDDEYNSLMRNDTWTLMPLPPGRTAIKNKWCFKIKQNSDGSVARYKARLVAKGYSQQYGIDYKDIFAPVIRFATVRTLLAVTALRDYSISQLDVSTAYLYADVEEEIYMEQPLGYEMSGPEGQKLVCRLNKSIYGLKQAGRNWNKHLDKWLKSYGLKQSRVDPCLYTARRSTALNFFAIAIYVDDILIISSRKEKTQDFIQKISKPFRITNLGEIHWLLGTKIVRTQGGLQLNQEKYINDILKRFGMQDCKPTVTPILPTKRPKEEEQQQVQTLQEKEKQTYMSIIGCLIYAAVMTRPDISFAVSKLSQKMSNPDHDDWIAAKRVLRYLKGSTSLALNYKKNETNELIGYVDADWGNDSDSRRSTTGYVFLLAGAAISWISKRQATVALSSTEAEYMAACTATREAIYLRQLLNNLEMAQPTTVLNIDNQGAIVLSKERVTSARTKHIDIQYHFIREKIHQNQIKPEYVATQDQIADCLTKAVGSQILRKGILSIFGQDLRP